MPQLSSKIENKEKELSVYGHLLELRVRLLWSLGAIIFLTVVSSFYSNTVLGILKNTGNIPGKLVYFSPYEGFLIYFKISLFAGAVLASPVIFYHIWMFVSPGLYEREKRLVFPFVILSVFFFISGVIFSFFIGIPFITKFLLGFGSDIRLSPKLGGNGYLDFVLSAGLAFGLVFEWPILVFFLARMRVISMFTLVRKRKYAVISVLVISAFIAPGISGMLVFSIPLYLLYEIGILMTKLMGI